MFPRNHVLFHSLFSARRLHPLNVGFQLEEKKSLLCSSGGSMVQLE